MLKRSVLAKRRLRRRLILWGCALALLAAPYLFSREKERVLSGRHMASGMFPVAVTSLKLLIDSTGWNETTDKRVIKQQIVDRLLATIDQAEQFVYADFFLWNPWQGAGSESYRALSSELADALIARKKAVPSLDVLVLTDPINRVYGDGGHEPKLFERMRKAGILVVYTDLNALRDSNRVYSPPVRFYGPLIQQADWLMRKLQKAFISNPFESDGESISAMQLFGLLHFKANHRKVLIADCGAENTLRMIVGSLNPADGSAAHSNLGLQLDGPLAAAALEQELGCVRWSAACLPDEDHKAIRFVVDQMNTAAAMVLSDVPFEASDVQGQWLTDGAIKEKIIELLKDMAASDHVRIGMFYLSDRDVVKAIIDAVESGARVDIILDANKDAFGRTKNGIPNRPVAAELMSASEKYDGRLAVRWAVTHGEQFHCKVMSITGADAKADRFICGSANWTRRNIGDFNLEADVYLEGASEINQAFNSWFDIIWKNSNGLLYTTDYADFADSSFFKKWMYRFQEATGAGTF